jgi:hypothetical protein
VISWRWRAAQQGAFKAKQLFVSDGDANLRRLRDANVPAAIYFLDLWHLQNRLAEALGEEAAKEQLGGLLTLAVRGDVDGMIEDLANARAAAGDDQRRHLLGRGHHLRRQQPRRDPKLLQARRPGIRRHREDHLTSPPVGGSSTTACPGTALVLTTSWPFAPSSTTSPGIAAGLPAVAELHSLRPSLPGAETLDASPTLPPPRRIGGGL